MIHAFAIAESIVAPTLFRPEFLHSLDPLQKSMKIVLSVDAFGNLRMSGYGRLPQPIVATQALNLSAGVSNSSVLRGRSGLDDRNFRAGRLGGS